jgi:dTDP-4-dehydrorhamnose 3,5-epimerase
MRFEPTRLSGAFIVEPEPHEDSRGSFARTFCAREFSEQGLASVFVQSSISFNRKRGTLRGLHYQLPPACEVKLVRCTAGALYDVIVDLRPGSPTYLQHIGVELTARNRRAVYVPEMFAHGLQTLEDDTEVFYEINAFYAPDKATGIRYDDPQLLINWPLPVAAIAERDRNWPSLAEHPEIRNSGANVARDIPRAGVI